MQKFCLIIFSLVLFSCCVTKNAKAQRLADTLVPHFARAQEAKIFKVKISFIDKKLILPLSPFQAIEKDHFCSLTFTDTTMSVTRMAAQNTAVLRILSQGDFIILNKANDNLRFLILSSEFDNYSMLDMKTALDFMYIIDLRGKKMRLYIYDNYLYSMSRKHVDIDFDAIGNKEGVIN